MGMFDEYAFLKTPPISPFADLPHDYEGLRRFMFDLYLSHDSVSAIAHDLWIKDGCPDGEQLDGRFGMKIRDLHWWRAKLMLEVVYDTDLTTVWHGLQHWLEQNGKDQKANAG